ncbi:SubName: Full=Uncharacterized protein {ECO:0000313/EMBL:CCA67122.1} [Serendipita indica DSM 11827]|nr:SubName: Full=Uncharacterized protein {ECO:0000313/EMBL:CCA67122.1} [Serendipita indica DSM 11827]
MVRGQESSCPRKHSSPLAEVHTARFFDPANILLERTGQHPGMELETQKWNILIHWLESRGMRIPTGGLAVEYREFEGSGRGLAVTRDVGPDEVLFSIPESCLINVDTLFKWAKRHKATGLTATQLLCLFLALFKSNLLDVAEDYAPYLDSLPETFRDHPLTVVVLHRQYKGQLPVEVAQKVDKIHVRFMSDVEKIQNIFPSVPIEAYLWGWLNVNTRSLYYSCKRAKSHQDNITLCPLLDFANHSFSATNFNSSYYRKNGHPIPTMLAPAKGLQAGEQLFLLYGFHSNPTLFTEYGFTDEHAPKEIQIDQAIEDLFQRDDEGKEKRELLESHGYWGDWTLHLDPPPVSPSYRLNPTLSLLQIHLKDNEQLRQWQQVLAGYAERVSVDNSRRSASTLREICTVYKIQAESHLGHVQDNENEAPIFDLRSTRRLWLEQLEITTLMLDALLSKQDGL